MRSRAPGMSKPGATVSDAVSRTGLGGVGSGGTARGAAQAVSRAVSVRASRRVINRFSRIGMTHRHGTERVGPHRAIAAYDR